MTEGDNADSGWFTAVDPGDSHAAAVAIRDGSAVTPREWPALAVESGFAADETAYYDALHEATVEATRSAVQEAETAGDKQLIHAVRAMDDRRRFLFQWPC